MFSKSSSSVMIDLLFNLLITFVALFFLSFVLIADPTEDEEKVDSDSLFIITMTWEEDNDIDIWLQLPTNERLFYGRREAGPAHLDLDVVAVRKYIAPDGTVYEVRPNQEIVTIRGFSLEGLHTLNAHFFGGVNVPTTVQVTVTDVKMKRVVWAGTKELSAVGTEVHFVQLDIEKRRKGSGYNVEVVDGPPVYFIRPRAGQ